jgi:hypothetical protein
MMEFAIAVCVASVTLRKSRLTKLDALLIQASKLVHEPHFCVSDKPICFPKHLRFAEAVLVLLEAVTHCVHAGSENRYSRSLGPPVGAVLFFASSSFCPNSLPVFRLTEYSRARGLTVDGLITVAAIRIQGRSALAARRGDRLNRRFIPRGRKFLPSAERAAALREWRGRTCRPSIGVRHR